jgi:hypothetical protein
MAPPVTRARANWAVEQATGLPEFWAIVSKYRGIVGTCQLLRVCKASHAGGTEHLRTVPGAGGVRRACWGCESGRRVEAGPGEDAVGAHA